MIANECGNFGTPEHTSDDSTQPDHIIDGEMTEDSTKIEAED